MEQLFLAAERRVSHFKISIWGCITCSIWAFAGRAPRQLLQLKKVLLQKQNQTVNRACHMRLTIEARQWSNYLTKIMRDKTVSFCSVLDRLLERTVCNQRKSSIARSKKHLASAGGASRSDLLLMGSFLDSVWGTANRRHSTRLPCNQSYFTTSSILLPPLAHVSAVSCRLITLWLQEWQRASAAGQWALMTMIVLYALTHFNEFRYITIKLEANVVDRKIFNDG